MRRKPQAGKKTVRTKNLAATTPAGAEAERSIRSAIIQIENEEILSKIYLTKMNKNAFWKTLKEKIAYSTPWLTVKEETVQLPNGEIVDNYSIVELRDVAMVFPLTKDNKVIMVRQYRHGVKKILLELPAGTYGKDKEDSETAAKRELWEETGYKAKKLFRLGEVYDYPTKDRHSISIYFTDDMIFEPTNFKEITEDAEVVKVPLGELEDYVNRGEISVSGIITAIYLAKEYLQNKKNI